MTVIVRPVEPDEIALLNGIEKSAAELFRDNGLDDVAEGGHLPAGFVLAFTRYGAALVAEVDRTVAGFALAAPYDQHAHLYEVSVGRNFQGRGIGRELVEGVCSWAQTKDFVAITLSTFRDVPWNAPFYASMGFRILEAPEWTPAFHVLYGREEDAGLDVSRRCFMRKDLS
jgi:GNAT superfamily N-acetyltransferase